MKRRDGKSFFQKNVGGVKKRKKWPKNAQSEGGTAAAPQDWRRSAGDKRRTKEGPSVGGGPQIHKTEVLFREWLDTGWGGA